MSFSNCRSIPTNAQLDTNEDGFGDTCNTAGCFGVVCANQPVRRVDSAPRDSHARKFRYFEAAISGLGVLTQSVPGRDVSLPSKSITYAVMLMFV
jgi:hypothetical protein